MDVLEEAVRLAQDLPITIEKETVLAFVDKKVLLTAARYFDKKSSVFFS